MTIKVYHGSNVVVESPLAGIGRENLDFGRGFYVTALPSQAEDWAGNKARYNMQNEGVVSVYELDKDTAIQNSRYHKFEAYDREWLHFIVDCRGGGDGWKQWDIIEGGVADNRVIDTVENYISGLIDETTALGLLSQHQPNHQICIVRQTVIDDYMKFVESYKVKAYAE